MGPTRFKSMFITSVSQAWKMLGLAPCSTRLATTIFACSMDVTMHTPAAVMLETLM